MRHALTMNGKGGYAKQRPVDLHELRREASFLVRDDDTTGKREIAVKPGVPYAASVCLDTNLEVPEVGLLRHWSNLRHT